MNKFVHVIFGSFLLLSLIACQLEKARPNKNQYLVIASDCLHSKDTILFKGFKKTAGIKVRIIHLSIDSIKFKLRSEGANCEIDGVILSSVYRMSLMDDANLLQTISPENLPENLQPKHFSKSKKWAGIGIDPFVLLTYSDTLKKIKTYRNLLNNISWCTDLEEASDWLPFYSFVIKKDNVKSKHTASDWIRQFTTNTQSNQSVSDSIGPCKTFLTTYSNYIDNQKTINSHKKKDKLVFPNQHIGGTYYNMVCFGIAKQAPNYSNALKFFTAILTKNLNNRINNALNTFPVNSDETSVYEYQRKLRFKKYHASPVQLVETYAKIEEILKTIN